MKNFVAILFLVQCALCYPQQQPAIGDQIQQTFSSIQEQSQKAVTDLNTRLLTLVGVRSNEELLNTVQSQAQTYIAQIKSVADSISAQQQSQQEQVGGLVGNLAKQLSEQASKFLAGNDPNKVNQIQQTFNSVLEQANTLQKTVQAQGTQIQSNVQENIAKIYESTLETANTIARQVDTANAKVKN